VNKRESRVFPAFKIQISKTQFCILGMLGSSKLQHALSLVIFPGCRHIYWSDCAVPTTIHTARIKDEGDHRILITGSNDSCIVGIAIDFHGMYVCMYVCMYVYF